MSKRETAPSLPASLEYWARGTSTDRVGFGGRQVAFKRYIGIDYSGAETATSRLSGLQVYESRPEHPDVSRVNSPAKTSQKWTRKEIAHWLAEQLAGDEP